MTNQEIIKTWENNKNFASMQSVRKGYTKTHTVKIGGKQFITFEAYRSLIVGKHNKTWCNTVDLIEEVFKDNYGMINYKVKDLTSGEVRIHGTKISINEVF